MELLRIGPVEQQVDFILRFDELALRVIVQAGTDSVLRANVAQVIVKLARSADVLPLEYLTGVGVRTVIAEPERKRQQWTGQSAAQAAVYANRRRLNTKIAQALMRRRGELVERSFAHLYDTGGMRRVHLRGKDNIAKRALIHAAAFNLSLIVSDHVET